MKLQMKNKKKAIIPVKGGLGNQMFFFAFGEYLKLKGFEVKYVWHELIVTTQHHGVDSLDCFNIKISKYENILIKIYLYINELNIPFILKRITYRLIRLRYIFFKKVIQRDPYGKLEQDISDSSNRYFRGFWQNSIYIVNQEKNLLNLFKFKNINDLENKKIIDEIENSNSVAIHVRRGDYHDPRFANLNVINSVEYFINAINYIKTLVSKPLFFIFTDDIEWAKININFDNVRYINTNIGKNSYFDMHIMSKCKHNIISNSTFSFWAAFLNDNPSKIVICPDYWVKWKKSEIIWGDKFIYLKSNF